MKSCSASPRFARRSLASAAGLVLSLVAGCDDHEGARRGPPPGAGATPTASLGALERALDIDAGTLEPERDPPAPAGDFRAEMERFTSIDACVGQPGHVDALVGDALDAIGYDTFLRDACRLLASAKARDADRCLAIDASPLRERCRALVAEITANADACPLISVTRPARGHDAACVAIASRQPALCAAAESDAVACEAVARHQMDRCKAAGARAEQARCTRAVARYASVLPEPVTGATLAPAEGRLELGGGDAGPAFDLGPELARGVVLLEDHDGAHVDVGPLTERGAGFVAPSPYGRATFAVELDLPPETAEVGASPGTGEAAHPQAGEHARPPAEARIARIEVLLPGKPAWRLDASRFAVTELRCDRERGGRLRFSIRGELPAPAASVATGGAPAGPSEPMRAVVDTFLRDVVRQKTR